MLINECITVDAIENNRPSNILSDLTLANQLCGNAMADCVICIYQKFKFDHTSNPINQFKVYVFLN